MQIIRHCFAFLLFPLIVSAQITDTLQRKIPERKIKYAFSASLSASYVAHHNWGGEDHTSFSFLSNVDFRHRLVLASGWSHDYLVKSELGYMNYTDSLWLKSADQFKISCQWNERPGKQLTHSYALLVQSQLLPSYRYILTDDDEWKQERKGWFMAPGLVELAYGLNWKFWEQCRINTAFATCRIRLLPKNEETVQRYHLAVTDNRIIKSEYGFSTQVYIWREFYERHFLWENQSRVFFNAIDKNAVYVDFSNRIALRFLKYFQFRIDSSFIYDPDISTKLSFRQELLLGLFYELKK